MIIQIGTEVDESRILWEYKESDEWERVDIDDLIEAYEGRPTGEWVDRWEGTFCSECDYKSNEYHNFCPNCGADMKGAE